MERDKKHDDPEQSKRFISTAREREADETKKGADKAFKKVAVSYPSSKNSKNPRA
ncbi:MAG: hypothetical protein KGL39_20180 [Patescibacteria group bacterium]|nr:hypothetical protein [Patescibacteria group bacterium]